MLTKYSSCCNKATKFFDYRQAQRYYSAATPSSLILTDAHGNHAMEDFEEKLPLVIEFFAHTIK